MQSCCVLERHEPWLQLSSFAIGATRSSYPAGPVGPRVRPNRDALADEPRGGTSHVGRVRPLPGGALRVVGPRERMMNRDTVPHDATELSPSQLSAIAALVAGANVTDAA